MKIIKLTVVFFTLLIAFLWKSGNVIALECSHPTLPIASDALISSDTVETSIVEVDSWDGITPADLDDNIYYVFSPKNKTPKTAFIFLPGGNSDPVAYAPAAHQIAAEGYLIVVLPMPSCVAMPFGQLRAGKIISDFENIDKWAIGGHSVGGTASCLYAKNHDIIDGVIIWASRPPNRLDNTQLKVLVVSGLEDGRCTPEMVEAEKIKLPADTIYVDIEGGNHSQFAYYDTYPALCLEGDKPATITLEEQQEIIVDKTSDFLNNLPQRPQPDGPCPAVNLLGADSLQLNTIRRFRDEVLRKNSAGVKLIGFYYNNSAAVISCFDRHPKAKIIAGKILEALVPIMEMGLNK